MVHNHTPSLRKLNPVDDCVTESPEMPLKASCDQTHLFLSVLPRIWFLSISEFETSLQEFEDLAGVEYQSLSENSAIHKVYRCYKHR